MTSGESSSQLQDGPELVRGYQKGLGHEERKKMLSAELYRGVEQFHDPNRFRETLRFVAQQPKRSFRNQLLVFLQHPSTQIALGPKDWQKKFGMRVAREEWDRPIWIAAPVLAWRNVVDEATGKEERRRVIVNTKPVPIYAQDQLEGDVPGLSPVRLHAAAPPLIWDHLVRWTDSQGYRTFLERPMTPGANGETSKTEHVIRILPRLSPMDQLITLGHEGFHIGLGHMERDEE